MTTWHWFGELLMLTNPRRPERVEGYWLRFKLGLGVWQKYGAWAITYAGYRPINQL